MIIEDLLFFMLVFILLKDTRIGNNLPVFMLSQMTGINNNSPILQLLNISSHNPMMGILNNIMGNNKDLSSIMKNINPNDMANIMSNFKSFMGNMDSSSFNKSGVTIDEDIGDFIDDYHDNFNEEVIPDYETSEILKDNIENIKSKSESNNLYRSSDANLNLIYALMPFCSKNQQEFIKKIRDSISLVETFDRMNAKWEKE